MLHILRGRANAYAPLLAFILFACAILMAIEGRAAPAKPAEKIKVVTSFTVIADIVRNVAGDAAIVESITRPGAEVHDYQPTPKDIIRARGADLVVWNGLNLERWFERFMADSEQTRAIVISEGVSPLSVYEGPYDGKPNPHAWMSPDNALVYVENIRRALVEIDPKNTDTYNRNAINYKQQIELVRANLKSVLDKIPASQRYLVSSEGAFSYLARDFRMSEVYLWPINADQQGTPKQVKKVIDIVREKKIPVVFSESTVSDKPAKRVAQETGARYGGVLYVDSLSEEDGPVPTYLDLLRVTTDTIAKGFSEPDGKTKP